MTPSIPAPIVELYRSLAKDQGVRRYALKMSLHIIGPYLRPTQGAKVQWILFTLIRAYPLYLKTDRLDKHQKESN